MGYTTFSDKPIYITNEWCPTLQPSSPTHANLWLRKPEIRELPMKAREAVNETNEEVLQAGAPVRNH